jgi:hypothetical protein
MDSRVALVSLTIFCALFAGCAGDSDGADSDIEVVSEPDWVNDRGTDGMWNLSLDQTKWLEVKSATMLVDNDDDPVERTVWGIAIYEQNGWVLEDSYSTIFGGNYTSCFHFSSGTCWSEDPDGRYTLVEWSVVYRIHDV